MRNQVSKSLALLAAVLGLMVVSVSPRALGQDAATTSEPGTPATKRSAARWAAPMRDGCTSVALIELEMSLASMIAEWVAGNRGSRRIG